MDPMKVMRAYSEGRHSIFGQAKDKPMFLHEDGTIFTKLELNKDLADLLAMYPELESPRDKWSGHSFRAGLATLLSILGFSKEEIQSWGRWRSDAYLVYIKDQTCRRLVSSKLKRTYERILSFL